MTTSAVGLPLIKAFKSDLFPLDRLDPASGIGEFLTKILVTERVDEVLDPGPGGRFEVGLTVADEAVLDIIGLDGFALVLGGASTTSFRIGVTFEPDRWEITVGAGARLRFPRSILKPVMRSGDAWVDDPSRAFAELTVSAGIIVDSDWNVDFDGSNAFHLDPSMIADSGLVIEGDVALDLSETRALPESTTLGLPVTWKGVVFRSLTVSLPDAVTQAVPISNLTFTNFHIGTGGVTGSIALNGTPADGSVGGFPFRPTRLEVELKQNCLVRAEIEGTLTLSFFDEPLEVTAGFDLDGNFTVGVSAASGLVELTKPGILTVSVDGIRFAVEDGVFIVGISGTITPLIGGLDWPGFTIEELSIDSEGHVRLEGGWLNLPDQYSLDFFGFTVSITRLGMGSTEDGGKWIGFSGSIKLVDGLSIGGSVDGLKVTWYDDGRPAKITLEGVGVELEIPEVLRFKGAVSYHELPGPQRRFDGDITLELLALDLRIDGKIVIGVDTNAQGEEYTFFALYVGVELPAGIPLWATGLGLYGIAGLVAIQMAPNKGAAPNVLHPSSSTDEEWFENLDGSNGWYKRPVVGVTDLRSKWDPIQDGFALGGGVTIGTLPDNGFTFNGSLLLVISFPGPVILLEGKANLLKERSSLTDDPIFRALVVLDFRAGNFLVGLDAKYKFGDDGEVIEIGGSAEAFFDFNDASRWHLYLGRKDPKEKRIRAQILSLFEANAYFMVDAEKLQMGAWVGYDKRWDFGPLSVVIEAWIEGGVIVSWKPVFFHGDIWLHGKVELRVFGFGFGLHADAKFACDVFDPFHILAELSVGISLPWPLPNFNVDITLEWGPTPDEPPLPVPLKEVAVEHFKSTASWPLPRTELLLPAVDAGNGFLVMPVPAADVSAAAPGNAPVVPLDARPHITFGRAVHDDALIGVNPQPVLPSAVPAGWERIGDPDQNQGPMRIRFALKEVVLSRWIGGSWIAEARKAANANAAGVKELYGSWAPMPQLPSGTVAPGTDPATAQVKLWLWSKTPFDFSVHGGHAWDEWFTDAFPSYPCVPPARARTVCSDFDDIPAGTRITLPMPSRQNPEQLYVGTTTGTVTALPAPSHGHVHAVCWDGDPAQTPTTSQVPATRQGAFGIILTGDPASQMTLVFAEASRHSEATCFDVDGDDNEVKFPLARNGTTVRIFGRDGGEVHSSRVTTIDGHRAVDLGWRAEATLPCPATAVQIVVWQGAAPVEVVAFDAAGTIVATAKGPNEQGVVSVKLGGHGIVRIVIEAPQDETRLISICNGCLQKGAPDVHVVGVDEHGIQSGPYLPAGDTVTVDVHDLRGVQVYARGRVCLVEVCVTYPASAADVAAHQDMAKRLSDSMALWGDEGEVLKPNSAYRLTIVTNVQAIGEAELSGVNHTTDVTELAYFTTQGPPALTALSTPVHHPPEEAFDSGLDDLVRYVRQTVPPTVPASGQQVFLPRPVYRAYDVGVEFNEDYVDLMYRLARRDLALYLYDSNNQPVRDVQGRLIVSPNRWGVTDTVTLTDSTVRYLSVIDQSECVSTDPEIIPHHKTLFAVDDRLVLDPDVVYQARLVPLLLHEDFRDGVGGWTVVDGGVNQGPSTWAARGHPDLRGTGATAAAAVVSLTGAGDLTALDPATDVVILSTDTARPSKTYRIVSVDNVTKKVTVDGTATLSSGASAWEVPGWGAVTQSANIWGGDDTAVGIPKPGTMLVGGDASWGDYRFSVLVRSADDDAIGVVFRYVDANNHYRVSMDRERRYRRLVRCVGGAFTTLAEDDYVFGTNQDYLLTVEAIGADLRVYQDGELVFVASDAAVPAGRIGLYCWANTGARFSDVRVDDFRHGAPIAYHFDFTTSAFVDFSHHLHSSDDTVWETEAADDSLATEQAAAVAPTTAVTGAESRAYESYAKKVLGAAAQTEVAAVEVHRVTVAENAVGMIVRSPEPIDWNRTTLAVTRAGGVVPPASPPDTGKLIGLSAGGATPNDETVTVLARERSTLAGSSIETYGIPGPLLETAHTVLIDDTFDRLGGILFEEAFGPNALDGYRIVDAAGATQGPSQWTVSGGAIVQTSNIWAGDFFGSNPARPGTVAVTGSRWGDIRLTSVLRSGDDDGIGVVFRYDTDKNWYRFSMDRQRPSRRLVKCVDGTVTTLWEDGLAYDQNRAYDVRIDAFGDTIIGYLDHARLFVIRDGAVREGQVGFFAFANIDARFESLRVESLDTSPLLLEDSLADTTTLEVTGTVALLNPSFTDAELTLSLRSSEPGSIGVVVRYVDPDNWYRFLMNSQTGLRRLIRAVGGVQSILWQANTPTQLNRSYRLTVQAEGRRLRAWLDGDALFDLIDTAHDGGRIGLYDWSNSGAIFSDLVVTDPVRRVGSWRILDETSYGGPSSWSARGGALRQTANVGVGIAPADRGTIALTGQSSWTDYRISVRMRSDDDDAIGVVFRYADQDNWLRLTFDAQRSYRRLVSCSAGVVSTLWQDAGGYTVGQAFTMTIDAIGPRIVGRTGDQLLFDLSDFTHPAGRVGLYSWVNTGARFERATIALPPLDAYAIFRDRFAAGDLSSWNIVDSGTVSAPSTWAFASGELRQTSNIYSNPQDPASIEKLGTMALAGSSAWGDIVFAARVQAFDDDAVGLVFRHVDNSNYYRFSMDRERTYRRLVRCAAGVFTTLWEDDVPFETGRAYDLVIASVGDRHTLWIDGIPALEVEDATHATGRIGLYTWANQDARFSSIRVFAPDRLALETRLVDDFDIPVPGLWSVVTGGDQLGPAAWDMSGGELHQTSNVWGGSTDATELAKPGTVALLTLPAGIGGAGLIPGSESWSDYRLSVRLRSTDDDAIGVVFRYQNEDNWYRFSMDRERSYRRLIASVAGVVSVLWSDTAPYVLGREYLVTIDAVADSLVGYINGTELFSVRDGSLSQGTIGLYAWANVGANFASVRVSDAGWSTHYTFGVDEPLVAAGTKIVIHSGNEVAWLAAPVPGVTRRFLAEAPDVGHLHLPTGRPLDTRLRNPIGEVGHARRFLQPAAYSPAGVQVLRNADGTELAIFAGVGLPKGQYRLTFTYRRNNTAAQPGSTILSRAGDHSDEVVVLDVPWS